MGLVIAQGIEALDVTVFGLPSIGSFRVPLNHGLTVLYGENGAGKTTVLEHIASALTGVKSARGADVRLRCRLSQDFIGPEPSDPRLLGLLGALVRQARPGGMVSDGQLRDYSPYVELIPDHPNWEDGFDGEVPYYDELEAFASEVENGLLTRVTRLLEDSPFLPAFLGPDSPMLDGVLELRRALLDSIHDQSQEINIALVPVGSKSQPAWEIYASSQLTETGGLRPHLAAISHHAEPTNFIWEYHLRSNPWLDDCLRFAETPFEAWTPRLFRIGSITAEGAVSCLWPSDAFDPDRKLVEVIGFGRNGPVSLLAWANDDGFALRPDVAASILSITDDANRIMHKALGPGRSLRFEANQPGLWVTEGFGRWMVDDGRLDPVPLALQGSAVRRWGTVALELSYRQYSHLRPLTLLIDEPENALHPAAQSHLAESLSFDDSGEGIDESVFGCIVASHSPALLAARNAHLLHVARTFDGGVSIEPIHKIGEVDALVNQLGVTRADVLAMTSGFVLVEGHHDEIVLNQLFRDDFARLRARIVRMDGASKAKAALNVELLATYSAARLVVVIDRLGSGAARIWQEAQDAAQQGDADAAARALHRMSRLPGAEADWVVEAGLHSLKTGSFHRIRLVGLTRPDIIEYLPVDGFVQGAAGWDELRRDYKASSDRVPFKDWLRTHRSARITPSTISAAASRIVDPEDLPLVLEALL
jgi:hypothetical protein